MSSLKNVGTDYIRTQISINIDFQSILLLWFFDVFKQFCVFIDAIGGDYYCDANFVNNNFCPEYDLFEGNKHTMVSTLHTCDFVPPSYFPNCDRAGCGTNAYNINPNMMCPEDRCTINTQKLYTVTHSHITVRISSFLSTFSKG